MVFFMAGHSTRWACEASIQSRRPATMALALTAERMFSILGSARDGPGMKTDVTVDAPMDVIEELKSQRLLRPASQLPAAPERVATGLAALDETCGGGLPRGRISELVVGTCGGASALYALLAAVAGQGEPAALVDPADGLHPASAQAAGVDLARLLWVRPAGVPAALRAAELILGAGGFGALALNLLPPAAADTHARPARAGPAQWLRLDRLARRQDALVLVLSKAGLAGTFASLVVRVAGCRARFGPDVGGDRWLQALDLSFALRKRRSA